MDGPEELAAAQVLLQGELGSDVAAVLDHAHPCLVLAKVERPRHRRHDVADVLEVFPPHAPGAVHQEDQVGDGAD